MVKTISVSDALFNKSFRLVLIGTSIVAAAAVTVLGYILLALNSIVPFEFHVFVVIGVIAGFIGPSILLILQDRRRNQIDSSLPRVLESIAEGLQAGLTLIESIEEVSKQDHGWISRELKTMVAQMSWGISIEDALESFANRVGTEMTKKTTALLTATIRLGGDLKSLFMSTAEFLHQMGEAKDERTEQLRPYLSIIYVTLVVFVVTMYMLYHSLSSLFDLQSNILKVEMTQDQLKILLFDLSTLEAIFGGLVASKLSSGTMLPGLKHSVVMMLVSTVCFITLF